MVCAARTIRPSPGPAPGVASPQNPTLPAGEAPNLAQSKGFEGPLAVLDPNEHILVRLDRDLGPSRKVQPG